jgi:hypothetical protein
MPVLHRIIPWPARFLPRQRGAARPAADAVVRPAGPAPANDASVAAPAAPHEALGERRAQALRSMFPLLFSMYARRSDLWQAIAIERYLSQATNLADLEQRIHEVQRRRHFGWSE